MKVSHEFLVSSKCYPLNTLYVVAATLLFGAFTSSAQTGNYRYSGSEQTIMLGPGTYDITAYGAQGGDYALYGTSLIVEGGFGAEMEGQFIFDTPTTLTLLVGGDGGFGAGASFSNAGNGGGGGGGSFIVNGNTPLVIAGGGGGRVASETLPAWLPMPALPAITASMAAAAVAVPLLIHPPLRFSLRFRVWRVRMVRRMARLLLRQFLNQPH